MRTLTLIFLIKFLFSINLIYAEGRPNLEESIDTGEEEWIEKDSLQLEENNFNNKNQLNSKSFPPQASKEVIKLIPYGIAKIIALNKITAQSKELTLKVGESKYFGNIEIKVHKCLKDPNVYAPDNKILLTIIEKKTDEEPNILFQGWMMSSNISISTFEHPVYEIFVKDCF